jgi:riboflavin synthase
MLADLEAGTAVNLERSATPTTRLGGHIVTGHVDAVGVIADVAKTEHWTTLRIAVPADIATQIAKKGSVAVDGVSLTVGAVGQSAGEDYFEVSLIPTTLAKTTLGSAVVGRRVNIETDVVAKYVQRILDGGQR